MCFSATASLTAGTLLAAAGLVAIARTPDRRSLPFAAMPLIFGIHQLSEGGLWLALESGDAAARACFATGFSFIAQVLWPVYVPLAAWLIEPDRRRRAVIAFFGLAGAAVGAELLFGLVTAPMIADPGAGHIHYRSTFIDTLFNAGLFVPSTGAYVLATCGSLLAASDRIVRAIGAAMAAAFLATYLFYETWLVSVWCFFAAALSLLVLAWIGSRGREPGAPLTFRSPSPLAPPQP